MNTRTAPWWPGLTAAFIAGLLAVAIGWFVPTLSPLLIAIVLGVLWRNTAGKPASWEPGIKIAGKRVLRIGIVALGFQVSLVDVLGLGLGTLLLVVLAVGVTLAASLLLGRALGIPAAQRTLIAAGFSICGAAAVVAVENVTDADENETATAVALVVVFGTLMIPLLPLAAAGLQLDPHAGAIWAGTSIHEVAQVVAAAGLINPDVLPVAVTIKLARVLCLAPMVALLAIGLRRRHAASAEATSLPPIVPLFIAGFVAAMLIRTTGVLPAPVLDVIAWVQRLLLASAMFALGLGVHVRSMLKVGGRPFLLAAASTAVIASIGLAGAYVLG